MKLRKVVKKIVALGTGATMLLGATLAPAMAAADLADYPAPFIDNGVFSGVLVIGNKAAAEDVIGISDVAISLQFAATKNVGSADGAGSTVTGDVFQVSASGDDLNLWEELSSVVSVVDKDDLEALGQGSLSNNKGTYTYDQYLTLGNSTVIWVVSEESDATEDPMLYFKAKQDANTDTKADGSEILTYKMSFPTALKSDIDSSRDLDDLDNKKVTLLGKEYTFTDTSYTSAGVLTLDMMGGAIQDTLEEGETKTYTVNGVEYEVTATTITDTAPYQSKFVINSETTDALQSGETYTMSDKSQIGIKEILPNEAGDVTADVVEFYLGAKKIQIQDNHIASNASGYAGKLVIGTNTISNAYVDVSGSNTSTEISISTIEIAWQLDDNYYVPMGGKLTDHLTDIDDLDFAEALNIDVEFADITNQGALDTVDIKPSGSNNLKLQMNLKSGDALSEEVFYTDGTSIFLGKTAAKQIHTTEATTVNISDENYFIVEANKYSHLLQLKKIDTTNSEIEIKDVASGDTDVISYSAGAATLYKDGYAFTFNGITSTKLGLGGICYDSGDTQADLWTEHGHKVELFNTTSGYNINITEAPAITRDDSYAADVISINATISSAKITPSIIKTTSPDYDTIDTSVKSPTISLDTNDNKVEGMTRWGTFIEQDTSGDQDTLKLTIPEKETVAKVYVTAGVTKTLEGVSGETDSVTIQKIDVGATKLASEVSDVKAQNAILVGGPCANAKVADVMGNPANCMTAISIEPGESVIKLYEHANGNVALVVAGYNALDTRTAAQVLARYKEYAGKLTGTSIKVTTATSSLTEFVETAAVDDADDDMGDVA